MVRTFFVIVFLMLFLTGCISTSTGEMVPNPNLAVRFTGTAVPVMLNAPTAGEISTTEFYESGQVIDIMMIYMGFFPYVIDASHNLKTPFREQLAPLLGTLPKSIYITDLEISEYAFSSYLAGMILEQTVLQMHAGAVGEVSGE